MSYTLDRVLDPLFWLKARTDFRRGLQNVKTMEDAVALAWTFDGPGLYNRLKPNQDRGELTTLASRVRDIKPEVIVELGTRGGGTLFTWSQCCDSVRLLVSIDLPGGIHGGGYPNQRTKFYRQFVANRPQCQLELLRVDSQSETTVNLLKQLLKGRPIDFLFIDADHRYEGVKRDFQLYSPLVRQGGLIAFHDIKPNVQDSNTQVDRFWDELKAEGRSVEEIVHSPYRGYFGIGVLNNS
jgi:cephalosporin hydroxylase